jgi:hypothetical protein
MTVLVHAIEDPLPDADPDLVVMQFGERGRPYPLDPVVRAFRQAVAVYPRAKIALTVGGWDDDPRPVWEIPEVAALFHLLTGELFSSGYDPLIHRLDQNTIAVLCQCGAWGTDHPFDVTITEGP